jgi:glycosyltransferase involved in cell wall biosynthesis
MLLVPSYFETFGLVIIEAMASGCFVAATNAGGPKEILGISCGLLFEPRSVKAIAEAIEKSIQQPEYRQICVNNALAKTSKYYSAEHQDFEFAKVLAKWKSTDGVTFPYLPIGD